MLAAVLRQREAGDDSELRRKVLDEHRHGVGPEQDPEKAVAELRAAEDVGGEVSGIDIGDGCDECGAEVGPHLVAVKVGQEAAARRLKVGRGCAGERGGHGRSCVRLSGGRGFQSRWVKLGHSAPVQG